MLESQVPKSTLFIAIVKGSMLVALACFSLLSPGCNGNKKGEDNSEFKLKTQKSQISLNKQSDQLDRVISQVRNEKVTDWDVFESTVTLALNNAWATLKKSSEDKPMKELISWERPALVESLPDVYKQSLWYKTFESENFLYTDALYIQEQYWLQQIVERTKATSDVGRFAYLTHAGQDEVARLDETLRKNDASLSADSAEKLSLGLQLFDWSVRNVTGDAFVAFNDEEMESERLQPTADDMPHSFAGVRGPGYTNYLWQTLNYGRGDVWAQAHLFMQLARNANLDVCVLAIPELEPTELMPRVSHPTLLPWAIGLAIDSKLYLFEPRMGLPMLHPKTLAVLTLDQLLADREILDWYSLTPQESTSESAVYPVSGDQLDELVALLDYPLEAISIRTKFVHENLVGDSRIPIYYSVDEIADRMGKIAGVKGVQLWALPLEINIFRGAVREAEQRSIRDQFAARRLQWTVLLEKYFDEFPLLRESRVLFLQGKFSPDQTGLKRDCLQELQQMRYSDEDISNIATDRQLQEALGLYQRDQSADEFSRQVKSTQFRMRVVRGDVQMFLAMAHQELRNFSTALNWLRLVKEFDTDGKWERHTLYLEGRNQEAMRHYEQAMAKYNATESKLSLRSPRDFGNVLRARILKQQLATTETEPETTKTE